MNFAPKFCRSLVSRCIIAACLSFLPVLLCTSQFHARTWCNDDEQFAQALEDSRERFVDLAESNLRKLVAGVPAIEKDENGEKRFAGWIERPSETAIIFTLKTRGKKRGYVERQEVTGADGAELIPPRTLSPEEARQYGLKLNEEY